MSHCDLCVFVCLNWVVSERSVCLLHATEHTLKCTNACGICALARFLLQLDGMYAEERRLQGIKDTLIAKAHRNVTLKKGAVLAFMTAQFGTLGKFASRVPATMYIQLYSVIIGSCA